MNRLYHYDTSNEIFERLKTLDFLRESDRGQFIDSRLGRFDLGVLISSKAELTELIINELHSLFDLRKVNYQFENFKELFSWSNYIVGKKDDQYALFVYDPRYAIDSFGKEYPIVILSLNEWNAQRNKMPPIAATMEDIHQLMEDYAEKTNTSYSRNTYNEYKKQTIKYPEKWLNLMEANQFKSLPFRHQYSKEEFSEIKKGFLGDMDTKWLIVFDESINMLYFYHMGQEAPIAKVAFNKEGDLYTTDFLQIAEHKTLDRQKNWLTWNSEEELKIFFNNIIKDFLLTNN